MAIGCGFENDRLADDGSPFISGSSAGRSAGLRDDELPHVGSDALAARLPGSRNAVMTVLDEIHPAHLEHIDGRQAVAHRPLPDALPALLDALAPGQEIDGEIAAASDAAANASQRNVAQAAVDLLVEHALVLHVIEGKE